MGLEDIEAWTTTLVRLVLWVVFLFLTKVAMPLTLAMDISLVGALLATQHGARSLAALGKMADAEAFLASQKGFMALGGFAAFGTLWQMWTCSCHGLPLGDSWRL